jgi:hypothetical protein
VGVIVGVGVDVEEGAIVVVDVVKLTVRSICSGWTSFPAKSPTSKVM